MKVLGIESSCDETSIAIVENGHRILALKTSSQIDLHRIYGGVVPELASRRHNEVLPSLLQEALTHADCSFQEIDLIAATYTPGLIGALLVGLSFAKALALCFHKPFIAVHHVEAHLYGALMSHPALFLDSHLPSPQLFPATGLCISGGHSEVHRIYALGKYERISHTVDDAPGEAFDKVASMLNLSYPGGPSLEKLALYGDPCRFPLTKPRVKQSPDLFSFSGLKTQVLYTIERLKKDALYDEQARADLAASFQKTIIEDIVEKTFSLHAKTQAKTLWVGGGVSANKTLRLAFEKKMQEECPNSLLLWPEFSLSLDQAAMIAGLAWHQYREAGPSPLSLQAQARMKLDDYIWPSLNDETKKNHKDETSFS